MPGRLVQSVFKKVLASDLTPALLEELKAVGLDASPGSEPVEQYSRTVWFRAIELTAAALFPSVGEPLEQQRQLGRHVISSLQTKNLLKGPFITMAKLVGPRRALKQAADFGADKLPLQFEVKEKSARELEVIVDEGRQSEFLAGLIEALVGILGGKDPRVATLSQTEHRAVFSATWR